MLQSVLRRDFTAAETFVFSFEVFPPDVLPVDEDVTVLRRDFTAAETFVFSFEVFPPDVLPVDEDVATFRRDFTEEETFAFVLEACFSLTATGRTFSFFTTVVSPVGSFKSDMERPASSITKCNSISLRVFSMFSNLSFKAERSSGRE